MKVYKIVRFVNSGAGAGIVLENFSEDEYPDFDLALEQLLKLCILKNEDSLYLSYGDSAQ